MFLLLRTGDGRLKLYLEQIERICFFDVFVGLAGYGLQRYNEVDLVAVCQHAVQRHLPGAVRDGDFRCQNILSGIVNRVSVDGAEILESSCHGKRSRCKQAEDSGDRRNFPCFLFHIYSFPGRCGRFLFRMQLLKYNIFYALLRGV